MQTKIEIVSVCLCNNARRCKLEAEEKGERGRRLATDTCFFWLRINYLYKKFVVGILFWPPSWPNPSQMAVGTRLNDAVLSWVNH